jgi:glycerol-3-phosphate dehydrogenase
VELTGFHTDPDGRLVSAVVHDRLHDQVGEIHARHIINATGVFAAEVEEMATSKPQITVEPSKGVHLIFSREDIPIGDHAVILPETDDRRVLFLVPWQSRVLFGTTDTGSGDLDHPQANAEDIEYLMKHLNRYLRKPLTRDHIISSYAGYRPLVKPRDDGHGSASLSRSHSVLQSPTGLVSIVGGKMTTYRQMAQDTVDVLEKRDGRKPRHQTKSLALLGSNGWQTVRERLALHNLPEDVVDKLVWSYGSEALGVLALLEHDHNLSKRLIEDLPYIRAQVIYACRECMAQSIEDVLSRRTSILFEDRQRGLGIVEEVAQMMAQELGWSPEIIEEQQRAYEEKVRSLIAAEQMVRV